MESNQPIEDPISLDLQNALQVWLHCVFYYRKIYPQKVFTLRNVYGINVPISKSSSLSKYLDNFVNQVKDHFHHLNNISVILLDKGLPTDKFVFNIASWQNQPHSNTIQKQLEFKKFYNQFYLLANPPFIPFDQFKLLIQYRLQFQNSTQSQRKILSQWIKIDNLAKQIHQTKAFASLIIPSLNIICERQIIKIDI